MPTQEECANPLLLGWVKEWWDTAKERNSMGKSTYQKAYKSLKACPQVFTHPSELKVLVGFGDKLCARLTEQLVQYCDENGLPMPEHPRGQRKRKGDSNAAAAGDDDSALEPTAAAPPAKKARKTKAYVPQLRSGAYALVMALAKLDENDMGLTKAELIEAAQPYCDSSFTASEPGQFYTAWNSCKTLKDKDYVSEKGRPLKRYALTDEGWEVAKRIQLAVDRGAGIAHAPCDDTVTNASVAQPRAPSPDLLVDHDPGPEDRKKIYEDVVAIGPVVSDGFLPRITPIRLSPGSFSVQLILDTREIRSKTDREYMQEELSKKGTNINVRSLALGDALWVAKCHDPDLLRRLGAEGDEIVLDHIVERKRLDDLQSSIRDGRFHEQKFRLKRSGVKYVTYIIEEMSMELSDRDRQGIESAIASTQVVNGFSVKKTQKMDDTIRYLSRMTSLLKKKYESNHLQIIPTKYLTARNYLPLLAHLRKNNTANYYITYPAFASLASKTDLMTLRDVFLRMLMCTRNVTGEKALQIQKRWKTPYEFVKAFEQCGSGEAGNKRKRELLSSQMSGLPQGKKIAKDLSAKIAQTWGDAL